MHVLLKYQLSYVFNLIIMHWKKINKNKTFETVCVILKFNPLIYLLSCTGVLNFDSDSTNKYKSLIASKMPAQQGKSI